jgi:hypothetical protein
MNLRQAPPAILKAAQGQLCRMAFNGSSRARHFDLHDGDPSAVQNELSTAQRVHIAASLRPEEKQDLDCAAIQAARGRRFSG